MTPYTDDYDHAAEARVVLQSKAVQRAFENIERAYLSAWTSTPSHDGTTLQQIRARQEALEQFKADLELMMNAGRIADFNTKLRRTSK